MDLSGYAVIVLLLLVSVYVLQICIRDFREARKSGKPRAFLSLLGAVLALGVIGIVLMVVILSTIGPLH